MNRSFLIFAFIAMQAFIGGAAADTATFNTQNNNLSLSAVRTSDAATFQSVIVRLTSFGTVAVNDARVGNSIEFDLSTNTLFLPSVTVDNVPYSKVSLTGLTFTVLQVNGLSVDSGSSGNYALDLVVTASGFSSPAIRINNIPKPNTQGEFCSEDVYQQFKQSVQGVSGSWQVTSCSFDGTTGLINALLSMSSPFPINVPYSIRYTYIAQ